MIKHLVEQPDALIADLAGLTVVERPALSVFLAVARQAAVWPGTPLLICAPDPGLASMLTGVAAPSADPAAGRGLMLVDATARRWGSLPTEGGKMVWATLPVAAR